jgi:hypothetical protein
MYKRRDYGMQIGKRPTKFKSMGIVEQSLILPKKRNVGETYLLHVLALEKFIFSAIFSKVTTWKLRQSDNSNRRAKLHH